MATKSLEKQIMDKLDHYNESLAQTKTDVAIHKSEMHSLKEMFTENIKAQIDNSKALSETLKTINDEQKKLDEKATFAKGGFYVFGAMFFIFIMVVIFFVRPTLENIVKEATETYIYTDKHAGRVSPDFAAAVADTPSIQENKKDIEWILGQMKAD